ncbi:MAG: hydrogen gas-evolving membrane-bound hydrogenase subunit E [Acidimicrobiales bacterium]
MLLLLAAHAVVGAVVLLLPARLTRAGFALGALPMVATLVYVALRWSDVTGGEVVGQSFEWVPGLELVADTRLDGFALLMVLLVSGMGMLVMAYSTSYFSPSANARRSAGLLVLFAGSMLGLVLADNLGWLYVCWELTSVTSFLLIGGDQATPAKRTAALQALLVTGAGGLAMLGGFVILAQAGGTWSLSELLADPPSGGAVGAGLGLVLAGVLTKSAQYPFHFWLPGAMVAPTPISAYLHSATMVKAGIYLAARFAPAFAAVGIWRPAVLGIALVTMVAGALRALRQHDLKLLLAFGTVSQLGFLLVLAGAGHPEATLAATVLLLSHAMFKGALFLVVGIIDHETGTRDIRELPRLGRGWGSVKAVAAVSALSMAGIPVMVGFVAKEAAYEAFVHGGAGNAAVLVGLVAGSVLTFAYSARFLMGVFGLGAGAENDAVAVHAPGRWFMAPVVLLGLGTVGTGLVVGPALDPLVGSAANAIDGAVGDPHLLLWHGFNGALLLSVVTIVVGTLLVLVRHPVSRLQARLAPSVRGDEGFAAVVRALNVVARRVTGFVQPGSLPLYIAVILLTVVGLPNVAVLANGTWPGWPEFSEIAAHPFLAALLVAAAVSVATVRRRFAAVLLLGAVGYSMALLFAFQGAADLALTQFAVETLSIVVFMMVVRHLPARFRPGRIRGANLVRFGVAVLVAAGVFSLAMMTGGGTGDRSTSEAIVERSEPEGGGKNVVNVVLVDVRGLDTLGEISVLTVSAVGVLALARVGRRSGRPGRRGEWEEVETS